MKCNNICGRNYYNSNSIPSQPLPNIVLFGTTADTTVNVPEGSEVVLLTISQPVLAGQNGISNIGATIQFTVENAGDWAVEVSIIMEVDTVMAQQLLYSTQGTTTLASQSFTIPVYGTQFIPFTTNSNNFQLSFDAINLNNILNDQITIPTSSISLIVSQN